MASVQLDGLRMLDWPSFHTESREKFGFPEFYGRNMDAWVDCLSGVRDDDGMSSFTLARDKSLLIEILHSEALRTIAPHILETLQACVEAVNDQYAEDGETPPLHLVLR